MEGLGGRRFFMSEVLLHGSSYARGAPVRKETLPGGGQADPATPHTGLPSGRYRPLSAVLSEARQSCFARSGGSAADWGRVEG